MEAIDLEAAQKRLEEKRALLKQTDPTPIGSELVEVEGPPLCSCGTVMVMTDYPEFITEKFGANHWECEPCKAILAEKHEAEYQAAIAVERKADEERRLKERIARNLKDCCIGERFMGMTFDHYIPENATAKKVLESCKGFVESFGPKSGNNLLLIGSPGTGKNMLAAVIGQEVIKKGFSFLHTTALRCVRRVKDSWRNKEVDEQDIIDSFIGPDLLVIDEVGVQFGSPTELLYLTEIINDRYEKKRPTILISNLTVKQLEEIIGARIMDRFYEGDSKFLVFNWPSYRRK